MKNLHIARNLLKGFFLASILFACNNENIVTPTEKAEANETGNNAKITGTTPQLLNDGPMQLQYYTAGRDAGKLWKVIANTGNINYDYYEVYTYFDHAIVRKRYKTSNDTKIGEIHYYLNWNNVCTESMNLNTGQSFIYDYNEIGQIIKISDKQDPDQHSDFEYQSDGTNLYKSLTKVSVFDYNNVKYKEIHYGYLLPNEPTTMLKEDKYKLNIITEKQEIPGLNDLYLKIFGQFNTNLIRQVRVKPFPYNGQVIPGHRYVYELNANGYTKSRMRIGFANGLDQNSTSVDYVYGQSYAQAPMQPGGI